MLKSEIRKIYKEKRYLLSENTLQTRSKAIANQFFQWDKLQNMECIHTFLPILSQKEPNTWDIIHHFWQEKTHISWVVSITHFQTKHLEHFYLEPHTELITNKWGIQEPHNAQPCPIDKIQLVLVPLLAFDSQGFRVGYGQGFYDRFLVQCPNALKVGISLEPVLEENIEDTDLYDIPLDYCITPWDIMSFSKQF